MTLPLCSVTVHVHPDCVSDPGADGRSVGAGVPQPGEQSKVLISHLKHTAGGVKFYLL